MYAVVLMSGEYFDNVSTSILSSQVLLYVWSEFATFYPEEIFHPGIV